MGFKDEKGKAKQDDKTPSGRVRKKRDINPDAAPAKPEKNSIYLARIKKQKELENPSESDASADGAPYPKKKYGDSDSKYPPKDKYSTRDKYPRKDNDSSKEGYKPRENKYPAKEGYKSKEGYTPRENKYPAKEGYKSKEGYTPRESKYPAKEGYRSKEGYTPRENKYPAKDGDGTSEGYTPRSKYPAKEGYKSKEGYTPKASYNSGDRAAKRRDDQDNNADQDFENFPKKYPSKDRYPSKSEGSFSRSKSDAYPRKSDEKRPFGYKKEDNGSYGGSKRSEYSSDRAPYAGRNSKNSDENSSLKYPRKQDNTAPYGAKKQNSFASRNASDKTDNNKNSGSKQDKEQDDDWEDLDKDTSHTLSYKLRNKKKSEEGDGENAKMPLNKYLAHCGICSRREAAELVKSGVIKVNGDVVVDPGYKVQDADVVLHLDKEVIVNKGLVYILLNKPKDYITTVEDEKGRKTVMQLVEGADADRLFPVGRLDRNTTGLLLITNDGTLAQKLSHPSYKTKKIYHVTLDRPITKADFDKIIEGVTLEDGLAVVDALAHLEKKNELGLEIHSGRNRIVRRIFEHLGYVVEKLDRVVYAGLTKKNVPRGRWRYLNEKEIILLKHFK